jgi:hypothetical protein
MVFRESAVGPRVTTSVSSPSTVPSSHAAGFCSVRSVKKLGSSAARARSVLMVLNMAAWKRDYPGRPVPLAMFAITATALLWAWAAAGVLVELAGILLPRAFGWSDLFKEACWLRALHHPAAVLSVRSRPIRSNNWG